ncbi:MAG: DUF4233 domain-containing protein [Mycobacterium sp.]|uniref:DUF4233 domain-containing protein n=1 Tax=Mycobacterium sp. TaxID=1785 RepID=UPI0026287815|nr:DUF4233 domain-containing protein [Mycobacterium sp.]MDI3313976.1 DUF4233 domain-containing protein [Mycobacterium sp.]
MIDRPERPEHRRDRPPPPVDPWRSFRLVLVATLILEAIVVLLALPVVGAVGGGLTAGSAGFLLGVAGVLLVLIGLQGRRWAIRVDLAVQALLIAGFVVYPGVGFIGVLFTAVWALIAYFAAEVRSRQHEPLADRRSPPR